MAISGTIVPKNLDVHSDRTGEAVILQFEDGEHRVDVVIARNQIPMLLSAVQRETRLEPTQTLESGALERGGIIQPVGHEFRRLPNRHVRLTFHLATDDGTRSLPLDLPPDLASELADYITAT